MEMNVPKISEGSLCVICGEYYEAVTSEVLHLEECPVVCKNCWNDYSGYRGEKETIYFNESIYFKSISSLLTPSSTTYSM